MRILLKIQQENILLNIFPHEHIRGKHVSTVELIKKEKSTIQGTQVIL